MIRVLLIFTTIITVVYCQGSCPNFPAFLTYPNSNGLQNDLTGTFFVAYTSATVISCQRAIYSVDANNVLTAHVASPGCCSSVYNFTFSAKELDYTIGPVPNYTSSCPGLVTENGSMKLLSTWGAGDSLCLIAAICQPDYYGVNVMCRGQPPTLLVIGTLLTNVLGLLTAQPALQTVNQTNCVYSSNDCPAF